MKLAFYLTIAMAFLTVVVLGAFMFATAVREREMSLNRVCPTLMDSGGFGDCVEGRK